MSWIFLDKMMVQDIIAGFLLFLFLFLFCFVFETGCPGTHSVNQDGLKLRNPPASASQVLGLTACATTT